MVPNSRRPRPLLPVLLFTACATGSGAGPTQLVVAEPERVVAAIRDEFRRERIPLDRTSSNSQVRSEMFDPAIAWVREEIPDRVICFDRDGNPVAPVGRITLRILVSVDYRGQGSVLESSPRPPVLTQSTAYTDVSIRSSGHVSQGTKASRGRCVLSDAFATELLNRTAGRFPSARGTRAVTGG